MRVNSTHNHLTGSAGQDRGTSGTLHYRSFQLLRKTAMVFTFVFLLFLKGFSQTTITTSYSASTFLTGNSLVTFSVNNSNASARWLTGLSMEFNTVAGSGTANMELWVSTTSLSGAPTVASPVWSLVTSSPVTISNGVIPVFSGLTYNLAPATQYRFAVRSSNGLVYGNAATTPNNFSGDGVDLRTGNFQVAGLNVGYTGTFPNGTLTPRFFSGSITVALPPPPCSAVPAPGNTISSVSNICPGINFNLSLQNTTTGSGVTYQWQSAPSASGPWTDIAGATGSALTTTQSAATCYRCNVTCAGNGTGTSTPVCVALTPPSGCYCTPPVTDCTDDDVITRVRLGSLDNASTCGTGPPAGYTNYTTTVAAPVVYAGAGNPITVNVPTTYTEQLAVWIDYNVNGQFEAAEFTNLGSSLGTGGTVTGTINIPSTAASGTTRMRVRVRFATPLGSGDACLGYAFGETEDYSIDIQPCVPVTVTGNPANATIGCGGNASFTVTTAGSLPAYSWQYRTGPSGAWQAVPDALPYSGTNTSVLTLNNVSESYTGYQFRALVSGGCSGLDFSGAATLTVSPMVPVVSPASAAICTGSVQQLTLTNVIPDTDLFRESWSAVSPLPAGWFAKNNSTPLGTTGWFQGDVTAFAARSGASNAYIAANFRNTTGDNTISNWLLTPTQSIKNGDFLTFWTRTVTDVAFPDRLEVRLSTNGASTNVGATNTSVGDFTTLMLTINPTLTTTGYPSVWTQYTVTVSGLAAPVTGRFAFRYFVTNGGTTGPNSDYIGIDDVKFTSAGGPASGTWTGPAGTMWTDAATTVPYTGTTANTIWVTPATTSTYGVSFTTLTPCTSATTNVPVNVVQPAVLVSSPADGSACTGGSRTFTVTATGGPLTYQWQRSTDGGLTYTNITGATSSTLTVTGITMSMTGYRYRCVISAAPCAGSVTSAAAVLTVNALPVVTLSSPDLLIIPGSLNETSITATSSPAAAAGGWVWTYNGNVITGNNTNTVTGIGVDKLGSYRATVTDINGCSATSAPIVIGGEPTDRLWIYPNPSEGQFQVRLYYDPAGIADIRAVSVYNAQGQLMERREYVLYNSAPYLRMDFDLSRQPDGVYVIKVAHKHTGRIVSGMLVKQSR